MKKTFIIFTALIFFNQFIFAQDEVKQTKGTLDLGTDIVSSYVWRSLEFSSGVNLQPWLDYSIGGFSIGTWGSFNLDGTFKEPDFYLAYNYENLTLTLNDFHANFGEDFFNFRNDETAHAGELMLQYQISESIPLILTDSNLVYGADKKIESVDPNTGDVTYSSDNNYSMYFEVAYSHTFANDVSLDVYSGVVPSESAFYGVDEFSLMNLGLKASKSIKLNENFSLPIHLVVTSNPKTKNMFYVIGISL